MILPVTLNKSALNRDAKYRDRFESPEIFQWESPNNMAQSSGQAQRLRHHHENDLPVHLFVRPKKLKESGTAAPFYYCGKLEFMDWEGEKPITVRWRLERPLPEKLFRLFGLSTK